MSAQRPVALATADRPRVEMSPSVVARLTDKEIHICLLTGGDDRPYALGMAAALTEQGIRVDFIGSDALDAPELHSSPLLNFRNLRGDQREDVGLLRKGKRILLYYVKLMHYALVARPKVFHILWNNKFELFDRTCLMLYYRCLGKRVILTAHNVNAAKRDARDSRMNRLSLWLQYRLCHHIFVHTQRMKDELLAEFGVRTADVSVIPFGINNTTPLTELTHDDARQRLGLAKDAKTILFFGQIAPYKGLEYLASAFATLVKTVPGVHLIIAGKVKRGSDEYWERIRAAIGESGASDSVTACVRFIPDDEVEQYFKAADVVALPYTQIFQSGVPFLAYSFGVPVIATDVGSLRDDIVDGTTGFVCSTRDPAALSEVITRFFSSELYRDRELRRAEIRGLAAQRHSWTTVGEIARSTYLAALDGQR
jgi:D-inositol-3-phosphate glycosyltransferase